MQLILIRHGEAEPYQADDAGRNLTARGISQAQWTTQQILAQYSPDLLVVSPYRRAQQTLLSFQDQLPTVPVKILDSITPDSDPRLALDQLSMLPSQYAAQCIVVVCHMNVIAYMAGLLLDEDPEGFDLAEARVFEQSLILLGFSVERARFVPSADVGR
ncbi:phosphohistidine phosphatase SixA [Aquirhabdus parva]|uniref:Phosphohistidine phosphatase SixA n=1 Tax=Aquirhabdus parva TaxID=2283318 RepID=A0A345P5J7_9GAMM|nr:phosphohistidine phosphatase SixA [Aquirhabdus parva]AXI02556.1 phosphohistidine phosphatase SixA [Aquirhabdus parva]